MKRIIRETKPIDITDVMQVIEAAKKIMRSSGNMYQWGDGYPSESVIFSDMEKHGGYVIEDTGRIVAYFAFLPLLWGQMTWEQSWTDFTMLPFTFPSMAGHLWFMYPLISLYLIMPVVSPWLERASARDERLFLCIFAISTLIPWLVRFVSSDLWGTCFWNPYFGMFYYCSGYLGYLVMAHYIRFHLSWDRGKKLRIGTICLLVGAAFTGWSFWHAGLPGKMIETPMLEWSWEFCTPNVLCATFGAFLLFTCIKQQQAPRWITSLSKLSFGMYLMHLFFLSNIAPIFVAGDQSNPLVPVWLAIPCIALLTFLCCAITTKIVSYVPGSKWIIG